MKKLLGTQMRRRISVFCAAVCIAVMMTGCGSAAKSTMDSAAEYSPQANGAMSMGGESYEEYEMAEAEEVYEDMKASDVSVENTAAVQSNRKLIKTVNLSVETKEFDEVLNTLQEQVVEMGGYIENMDSYNGSYYSSYNECRNASLVLRVPKEELDGFLDTISGICNIVRRSESVEDVTLSYVDVESHRNALRAEEKKLLEFMDLAETIEDMITVEDRLSYVRYQLESMESQLRTYDNKIDYSTVYLDIEEVEELTPVAEETTWEIIADGFIDNLKSVGNGFKNIMIWFIVSIPHLAVWAVVITLIIVIIKTSAKRSKKKKEAQLQKLQMQQETKGQTNE